MNFCIETANINILQGCAEAHSRRGESLLEIYSGRAINLRKLVAFWATRRPRNSLQYGAGAVRSWCCAGGRWGRCCCCRCCIKLQAERDNAIECRCVVWHSWDKRLTDSQWYDSQWLLRRLVTFSLLLCSVSTLSVVGVNNIRKSQRCFLNYEILLHYGNIRH